MTTALVKKCPTDVSELKQRRSREQGKLQALLDSVNKKLDKVVDEGEEPWGDVTVAAATATHAGNEVPVLPYRPTTCCSSRPQVAPPGTRPTWGQGRS